MSAMQISVHFLKNFHRLMLGAPIIFISLFAGTSFATGNLITTKISSSPFLVSGEKVTIEVIADIKTPSNAIAGSIGIPKNIFTLDSIDTKQSIIDIWAEQPSLDSEGLHINFAGGITSQNGFSGKGTLFTFTGTVHETGKGKIAIEHGEVLARDGNGTPLVFKTVETTLYTRDKALPSPDINADGVITVQDMSIIYLSTFRSYNKVYDLNNDGRVNWKDVLVVTTYAD